MARKLGHDEGWTLPPDTPFYPPLPARYRGVRFQLVWCVADPAAMDDYLPEPLSAHEDGAIVAGGLDIPESHYGTFQESFLMLHARWGAEEGYFCTHVFHNGPAGIAAGREIYGTPKLYADVAIRAAGDEMETVSRYRGTELLVIRTRTPEPLCGEIPALAPAWRLKLIPRADSPRPALKQLIDCAGVVQDFVARERRQGEGELILGGDLAALKPRQALRAVTQVCDYQEGFARTVYDYLAGPGC
jgi:acetoacetate decarboxylase